MTLESFAYDVFIQLRKIRMELITDLLESPEALFAGKLLLATSLFLCSYATISKVTSTIFRSNKFASHGLAILISLYAFQIPFPPSAGPVLIPFMWEVTRLFSLVVLVISLSIVKYMSGVGLMVSQFEKRKIWVAILVAALFILGIFLPVIVQLLRNQLGEFFSLAYNLSRLLNFGLTLVGAVKGVFGVFREIVEWIIGKGHLAHAITVSFIVLSIIVVPQMIPHSSIITKLASTVAILTAWRYRSSRFYA